MVCYALAIYFLVPNSTVYKIGFHTKEEELTEKKQLSQLNRTLNEFVIGNGTNVSAMENETLEPQTSVHYTEFEKIIDSASQNQVKGKSFDDRIWDVVDNAVMTVAILTKRDKMVIPRVEMSERSNTASSAHGPNNVLQNFDRKAFTGNTKNTPPTSRSDLNINQDRIGESRDFEKFDDVDFAALKPNYDRQAHTHHMVTGHNAPQSTMPDVLTGRVRTQNNP